MIIYLKELKLKINKISNKKFKGKVFDITVEEDHNYTVSSCVVHNSAGGSLLAFCLGITKLDPIKFNLIFERFMSDQRVCNVVYNWFGEN